MPSGVQNVHSNSTLSINIIKAFHVCNNPKLTQSCKPYGVTVIYHHIASYRQDIMYAYPVRIG